MRSLVLTGGLIMIVSLSACENKVEDKPLNEQADQFLQLIARGEVKGELRPFDLVENPTYRSVHEVDFLQDDEYVFLSKACGYILVYPHRSMYVEVVNEESNGVYMAVTYCPITRSGICFDRLQGGDTLLLTASGYLFRENMVPLDLQTGSLWSQMQLRGMRGKHQREVARTIPLVETSWKTIKDYFPSAGVYIVESFSKSSPNYEQEFGIVGLNETELFTLDMFPGEISLHTTSVRPEGKVIVAGSTIHRYMVAYLTNYLMVAVEGRFPVIMKDETGTLWNIFGEAVSGERGGEQLKSPVAYTAADWAWDELLVNVKYFAKD
ncbi:MAG: DUF3179 domain-containing protein [Bacteroidetes bacterium]|nr:DUF3179 domain-containing protein [Bacteroidota bacterium]